MVYPDVASEFIFIQYCGVSLAYSYPGAVVFRQGRCILIIGMEIYAKPTADSCTDAPRA